MKKVVKVLSVIIAPIMLVCTFLFGGCKKGKEIKIDNDGIMQDLDVAPDQTPAYEQYSRQAIEEYKAVAQNHMKGGDVDYENEEVDRAARAAAAKLYAYACYNERTLDQYAWFSDKRGGTDLGASGSAQVIKQDYYLRINENAERCGYRYYYTYKYVQEAQGGVSWFKSQFEAARLRITVDTDTMYRFQGKNMHIGNPNESMGINEMVTADWETKNDEWGVKDLAMVKEDFIKPEDIQADIIKQADDYFNDKQWTITIHGNINILAENIVKSAMIVEESGGGYLIIMNIDTDVANKDKASVQMLTKENGTNGDCNWKPNSEPGEFGIGEDTGMKIIFRIWDNGLFRFYGIQERWTGKIVGFSGEADSSISVYYSYSDNDCDMTRNLEVLEEAKRLMND